MTTQWQAAIKPMSLLHKDLLSIGDLTKAQIETILDEALRMKQGEAPDLLKGKILATCFYEPSTRTRLSFETAMHRLGGAVIGFAEQASTSAQKGETLSDAMRVIGSYADILVIRHPAEGSARVAAEAASIPVINAGDGANQHPTQTLVDLFTIQERHGTLAKLHIALAGDLKFSRTVHSLALGLCHFPVRLYFISPEELCLPEQIAAELRNASLKFSYHATLSEVLPKLDVLYMTRRQLERNAAFATPFILRPEDFRNAKPTLSLLHPLPRVNEIDPAVDALPQAAYFDQAANGVCVRQALLALLLGAR